MLKLFISYYKKHLRLFILDMLCASLFALVNLVTPYIVGVLIDDAIPSKNMDAIVTLSIVIVCFAFLSPIFRFIITYYGHMMGTKIERDMRIDLFKHLQRMDSKFFVDKRVGELMSRIIGDLRDISEFSHHGPEDLFLSILMIFGSLIIMITISPLLTLVIFILLLLTIFASGSRRKKMSKAFSKTRVSQADLNNQTENSLSGIAVVKSYTNEDFEIDRFVNTSFKYQDSWSEAYFESGVFSFFVVLGTKLILSLTLVFASVLAYRGYMTVGEVATFVLYITFFTGPINSLMSFVDQYQKGWSGFKRFYEILQVDDKIKGGSVEYVGLKESIVFKNVSFEYEEEKVIKNFSLEIPKNRSVALVGKTGVGKSTIAKLLPRFYDVTSGSVCIDGINIKDYDIQGLRDGIGYVEQDSYIFYGTILENILYGRPDASFEQVKEAAKLASLDEFIDSLEQGYNTDVGAKGIKLSGGQKQRLSLARMFLKQPDVLVLDEATSALDNKTELQVQKAIEKLCKNSTSLIIAHRLTTIENCDEICLLDENGIVERGTHEQLMDLKKEYYEMYMSASF